MALVLPPKRDANPRPVQEASLSIVFLRRHHSRRVAAQYDALYSRCHSHQGESRLIPICQAYAHYRYREPSEQVFDQLARRALAAADGAASELFPFRVEIAVSSEEGTLKLKTTIAVLASVLVFYGDIRQSIDQVALDATDPVNLGETGGDVELVSILRGGGWVDPSFGGQDRRLR